MKDRSTSIKVIGLSAIVTMTLATLAPSAMADSAEDIASPQGDRIGTIIRTLESHGFETEADNNGNIAVVDGQTSHADSVRADATGTPAVILVTDDSRNAPDVYQVGHQAENTLIVMPDVPAQDALNAIAEWTSNEEVADSSADPPGNSPTMGTDGQGSAIPASNCTNSFVAPGTSTWSNPLISCGVGTGGADGQMPYRYSVHSYVSYGACYRLKGYSIDRHGLTQPYWTSGGCSFPSYSWTYGGAAWPSNLLGKPYIKVKSATVPFGSSGSWQSPVFA